MLQFSNLVYLKYMLHYYLFLCHLMVLFICMMSFFVIKYLNIILLEQALRAAFEPAEGVAKDCETGWSEGETSPSFLFVHQLVAFFC